MRASARIWLVASIATLAAVTVAAPATVSAAENPSAPSIARAYNTWAAVLEAADCDGAEVAALYTPRAILLATFKEYVQGRAAITNYFDDLTCKENLAVDTQRSTSVRRGSMGYATGLYTFSYTSVDGTKVEVPARFTFVFEQRNGRWMIVNHHSSQNPQAH